VSPYLQGKIKTQLIVTLYRRTPIWWFAIVKPNGNGAFADANNVKGATLRRASEKLLARRLTVMSKNI
jgi:hypothetical protein